MIWWKILPYNQRTFFTERLGGRKKRDPKIPFLFPASPSLSVAPAVQHRPDVTEDTRHGLHFSIASTP